MVKIWFLLVLLSIQNEQALVYRGFLGYSSEEKCLQRAVDAENFMIDVEIRKGTGNSIWIESFCIAFDIFDSEVIKKNDKPKGTES